MRHRHSILVARAGLVILMTPVIVVAGLLAAAVLPAALLCRHIAVWIVARRRPARASVLQLEASPAESSVGM
jgi:hypothetical protein